MKKTISEIVGYKNTEDVIKTKNNYGVNILKIYPCLDKYLSTVKVGGSLLDIGCGYGTSCSIPAMEKGIDVTGVDLDQRHLDVLNELTKDKKYKAETRGGPRKPDHLLRLDLRVKKKPIRRFKNDLNKKELLKFIQKTSGLSCYQRRRHNGGTFIKVWCSCRSHQPMETPCS